MKQLEKECAAARIQNYLDDHEVSTKRFAFSIGRSQHAVEGLLAGESTATIGAPGLRECARVMGISYEKLISPLTAADYGGVEA